MPSSPLIKGSFVSLLPLLLFAGVGADAGFDAGAGEGADVGDGVFPPTAGAVVAPVDDEDDLLPAP